MRISNTLWGPRNSCVSLPDCLIWQTLWQFGLKPTGINQTLLVTRHYAPTQIRHNPKTGDNWLGVGFGYPEAVCSAHTHSPVLSVRQTQVQHTDYPASVQKSSREAPLWEFTCSLWGVDEMFLDSSICSRCNAKTSHQIHPEICSTWPHINNSVTGVPWLPG